MVDRSRQIPARRRHPVASAREWAILESAEDPNADFYNAFPRLRAFTTTSDASLPTISYSDPAVQGEQSGGWRFIMNRYMGPRAVTTGSTPSFSEDYAAWLRSLTSQWTSRYFEDPRPAAELRELLDGWSTDELERREAIAMYFRRWRAAAVSAVSERAGKIEPEKFSELFAVSGSGRIDPETRTAAATQLLALLNSQSAAVRYSAAEALAGHETASILPAIRTAIRFEKNRAVRTMLEALLA